MPIHAKKVHIELEKDTPTPLTAKGLQRQLRNIGLKCEDTYLPMLEQYIAEVKSQIPDGATQTFGISAPKKSVDGSPSFRSEFDAESALYLGLEEAAAGNWKPSETALGYMTDLQFIQYPTHFDYLMRNRPSFAGVQKGPLSYKGRYPTVAAIRELFKEVGTNASATVVNGLDKDSMESVLSNAMAPLPERQNYDNADSRVVYLVDNYNPTTQEADGIGVLTVNWHLVIKNYRKKRKDALKHDMALTVSARSVLYDSIDALKADVEFVKSHFRSNTFCLAIPRRDKLVIFDKLPPADPDTARKSLPTIAKEQYVDAIVLYAPDLTSIGCLDNSDSDAESRYSKSVTSGFTFTISHTFSAELSFEATVEVVKAGFKMGFSLTFTEQWNESTTETMEFVVPAGKKAFTYQGYLNAATLRYDPGSDAYKYVDYGKFMTNILATTRIPLVSDPKS